MAKHHGSECGRMERWLSRETHKYIAELVVLLVAYYLGEGTIALLHAARYGLGLA